VCSSDLELLDPAIWRRFDVTLEFPRPSKDEVEALIASRLNLATGPTSISRTVSLMMRDATFSDVDRLAVSARRNAIVDDVSIEVALLSLLANSAMEAPIDQRIAVGVHLIAAGQSQRRASLLTGIARDTLRKHMASNRAKPSRIRKQRRVED